LPHYYFDIETTGLDPETDEILTIQYQKISVHTGKAAGPLTILSSWEYSEEDIVKEIAINMLDEYPWNFVPVGNNLTFEFKFLSCKINKYLGKEIDVGYFMTRPHIDLKSVMILANSGRFKGCHLVLGKQGNGADVPLWYQIGEYQKIIEYIKDEANCFLNFTAEAQRILGERFMGAQRNVQ
jgi:hypothetical protein